MQKQRHFKLAYRSLGNEIIVFRITLGTNGGTITIYFKCQQTRLNVCCLDVCRFSDYFPFIHFLCHAIEPHFQEQHRERESENVISVILVAAMIFT